MTIQQQIFNHVHLPGNVKGQAYLPLCAKPNFLAMLDMHPNLLKETIQHCVDTTKEGILIFIADGAVMEEALMAVSKRPAQAKRITSSVSVRIRNKVDDALVELKNSPNYHRIKGVVHWKDIKEDKRFQDVFTGMEHIMRMDIKSEDENLGSLAQVQYHVKALIKNLFTQRVEKARKAGSNISNVFVGDGFEMRKGAKYMKRYCHLERACLLELSMILVGAEYKEQVFTEMKYLTNDPQGMTYIAACLEGLRKTICAIPDKLKDIQVLKEASLVSHGIIFVKIANEQSNEEGNAHKVGRQHSCDIVKIGQVEKTQQHKSDSPASVAA